MHPRRMVNGVDDTTGLQVVNLTGLETCQTRSELSGTVSRRAPRPPRAPALLCASLLATSSPKE